MAPLHDIQIEQLTRSNRSLRSSNDELTGALVAIGEKLGVTLQEGHDFGNGDYRAWFTFNGNNYETRRAAIDAALEKVTAAPRFPVPAGLTPAYFIAKRTADGSLPSTNDADNNQLVPEAHELFLGLEIRKPHHPVWNHYAVYYALVSKTIAEVSKRPDGTIDHHLKLD